MRYLCPIVVLVYVVVRACPRFRSVYWTLIFRQGFTQAVARLTAIQCMFGGKPDLQHNEGKTIIMVEQNAKKGLEFADIGYVLVSGEVAVAGAGSDLLANPKVGELFLAG